MRLAIIFEHEELLALQSAVVVEMWRTVMTTGVGKRKFAAEFTPEEQDKIREYYKIFYTWHFGKVSGTGVPQQHTMPVETYQLMQRACNFFGTYG